MGGWGLSALIKRSFSLAGHRTSVALEAEFWAALGRLATARRQSLSALVAAADVGRDTGRPLASALRVLALQELPLLAADKLGLPGTPGDGVPGGGGSAHTPAGDVPAGDVPAGDVPAGEAPATRAPTGGAQAGGAQAGGAQAGGAPAGGASAAGAPGREASTGGVPGRAAAGGKENADPQQNDPPD